MHSTLPIPCKYKLESFSVAGFLCNLGPVSYLFYTLSIILSVESICWKMLTSGVMEVSRRIGIVAVFFFHFDIFTRNTKANGGIPNCYEVQVLMLYLLSADTYCIGLSYKFFSSRKANSVGTDPEVSLSRIIL